MKATIAGVVTIVALAAGAAGAQDKDADKDRLVVRKDVVAVQQGEGPLMADHTLAFLWAREGFGGRPVKGAPYSAEAVTETVQTLADGNRIVRRTSAQVARDGEGRTRRENALAAVGPMLAGGDGPQAVFIEDPVAGAHYVLHPEEKTARRFKAPAKGAGGPGPVIEEDIEVIHPGPGGEANVVYGPAAAVGGPEVAMGFATAPVAGVSARKFTRRLPKPKEETLARQSFDGVEAEGTRTSFTIAAGEIGNERPIEVVSERWYSPELQVVVMSRHRDPRFGETTYRLTNLSRGEPDRALFEVPADFKVETGPGRRVIHMRKPGAPTKE
jgi:hypothetical protein